MFTIHQDAHAQEAVLTTLRLLIVYHDNDDLLNGRIKIFNRYGGCEAVSNLIKQHSMGTLKKRAAVENKKTPGEKQHLLDQIKTARRIIISAFQFLTHLVADSASKRRILQGSACESGAALLRNPLD